MSEPLTLPSAPAERPHCQRCGQVLAPSPTSAAPASWCPRCGAPVEIAAADVQDDWPAPPAGLAQIGYILLLLFGALVTIGGVMSALLAATFRGGVLDMALATAASVVGASIALHGLRAFAVRRWRVLSLPSPWAWLGGMILVWGLGILLPRALPGLARWTMPPLIVIGAGTASALFLSATLRGLTAPEGRKALAGRLIPRHSVLLSTSLSASLSTALALVLEAIALIGVMTVMLATSQLLGDESTVALLMDAAQDPETMERLEEMITRSPVALLGLGCILVFVAPAIEEGVKAIPLLLFARRRAQLSERTAILIGVAGGVGFAFAENVGYLGMLVDEWWLTFWFRAAAAMMHGAASGFIGRAWYQGVKRGRWGAMLLDLCRGWGIHAFWNALALVVGWFAYREVMEGVLFTVGIGLIPLAILFTVMARWGIWVNET